MAETILQKYEARRKLDLEMAVIILTDPLNFPGLMQDWARRVVRDEKALAKSAEQA